MPIEEIVSGIQGHDPVKQHAATQACRKMLSRECNPPINNVIKTGVVPRMVTFLDQEDRWVLHLQKSDCIVKNFCNI